MSNVSTHITKTNELIKEMSQSGQTVNGLVDAGISGMDKTGHDFTTLLSSISKTKQQNEEIDRKMK
ncbi:hypothetical protein [Domibacillus iocasae]|uniref:hypothetical protein n=1 Tax=Domibacillus iocasae TaxID=1714016 RepID=UPI0009F1A312|nr:hypothetical protein [Domibacillus iocasae]